MLRASSSMNSFLRRRLICSFSPVGKHHVAAGDGLDVLLVDQIALVAAQEALAVQPLFGVLQVPVPGSWPFSV